MVIAQKAVIKKGELFLVLHRSEEESAFPGLWDFPGGRVEEGEEYIESLKREVLEETALEITPCPAPIGVYYAESHPGRLVEFRVYAIEEFTGEVKLGKEHSEYKWMSKQEILALPAMPFMRPFFEETF